MNLSLKLSSPQYILSLGIIRDHKNIARLIDGFKLMIDAGYTGNLILAGKEDTRYTEPRDRIRELALQNRVQFVGQVNPTERIYLLQQAALFVMPSLYEGFGIPILEALTAGTPVIASNSSSLPEVGGNAVKYFHPLRPDELAKVALEVLGSPSLQAEMRFAGYAQAAKFSWEKTAKETLAVYEKILVD